MSDFNFHIAPLSKLLNLLGLKGSLDPNTPTHSSGNQIDQIFTNQSITHSYTSIPPFPTDYTLITTTIEKNLIVIKNSALKKNN
jgi:hypothetical protein